MTLTEDVKECARDVDAELNPHLRENAYQEAMKVALSDEGIQYTEEATIPIQYRGFPIARVHPDMIVGDDERYIIELKVGHDGTEQLKTYIEYADKIDMECEGGLMISFGEDLLINEV